NRLNAVTFSLVEVSLTINTNFNTCLAPNPNGQYGQIRNYRIYWVQTTTTNSLDIPEVEPMNTSHLHTRRINHDTISE
ncbi:MAG TPA: hypothetical protein VN207_04380, partial [Ktedonobacteraceae bacterium]|nr:hypothetical protein [Ktedonobacteraceae bacterium]